ncbi:efflux RND transporter permease subunit, partial [Salmonella enterica]|uniref:efflux RND transporter permease subunit n=1 Tax=Salmonella enterica TaxID=28901 RepID=UPI00398C3118
QVRQGKEGDATLLTLSYVPTEVSMASKDIAADGDRNVKNPPSRVNGVGDIDEYGSKYSMGIWLHPATLNSFQMTTKDVTDAIESLNAPIAVGQLGGTPYDDQQAPKSTIKTRSCLQTPLPCRNTTLLLIIERPHVHTRQL